MLRKLSWLAALALLAVGWPGAAPAQAAPLADASTTLVVIDTPRGGPTSTQLEVRGWAADPSAATGTGIDRVEVYIDGPRDGGGTPLGPVTYGLRRPDVAAHLGSQQFLLSGYAVRGTVSPGPHTVYVYAHPSDQPASQGWSEPKQAALVAVSGSGPAADLGASYPGGAVTLRLPGVTGSVTYDLPYGLGVGANYPPGPADTGGPIYAPIYFGYGLYGGVLPYPDYPPYYGYGATWVPSSFDFSYGYGYDFYSLPYLAVPRYPFAGVYRSYPWWYGRSGPVYCPVYTAVVC